MLKTSSFGNRSLGNPNANGKVVQMSVAETLLKEERAAKDRLQASTDELIRQQSNHIAVQNSQLARMQAMIDQLQAKLADMESELADARHVEMMAEDFGESVADKLRFSLKKNEVELVHRVVTVDSGCDDMIPRTINVKRELRDGSVVEVCLTLLEKVSYEAEIVSWSEA